MVCAMISMWSFCLLPGLEYKKRTFYSKFSLIHLLLSDSIRDSKVTRMKEMISTEPAAWVFFQAAVSFSSQRS